MPFEHELQIFENEQGTAQRSFLAYMSIRTVALANADVNASLRTNGLFWTTVHESLMSTTFIALGRIFDTNSESHHTVYKLLKSLEENLPEFTKNALIERRVKVGMSRVEAEIYASNIHELNINDVRAMRGLVKDWKAIYDDRYRNVRDLVYAHNRNRETMRKLLARTNFDEMQSMLGFLAGLHDSLWHVWHNGIRPVVAVRQFSLPPVGGVYASAGEIVFAEGQQVLRMVEKPDPDELRYNAGDFS